MLDFSVLVRDEDGRRKSGGRKGRGAFFRSFETMKTWDYFGSSRSGLIRIATMVWRGPFAIDNWILRTTLVELQIFPFRENFLTVAFDRRYLRSLLCLSFPSLFFLPSFLPSLPPSFFPSFLRFLRFQSLRSRGAAFLSIRAWRKIRYRVSLFLWFQPLREISFSLNHRRMEVVARFANHLSHIRHFSLSSFNTFSFSLSLFLIFLILP